MKKLLLLPLLLLISVNASAAIFTIVNGNDGNGNNGIDHHIRITFKLCTPAGCTFQEADGPPGNILKKEIEILPDQTVAVTEVMNSLNGAPLVESEIRCRLKLVDNREEVSLVFAVLGSRLICMAMR